jgi:hypothetical protein
MDSVVVPRDASIDCQLERKLIGIGSEDNARFMPDAPTGPFPWLPPVAIPRHWLGLPPAPFSIAEAMLMTRITAGVMPKEH